MDTAEDADEDAGEEERTAWYAPGLYRRIGRRRARAERRKRVTVRQRLSARGLHWNTELVVGIFVAVLVVSLATVSIVRIGAGRTVDFAPGTTSSAGGSGGGAAGAGSGPGGGSGAFPTPTAPCIAAPIPGSAMRPCTW